MTQPTGAASGCAAERHGTADAYQHHGCRCPIARRALRRLVVTRELAHLAHRPPMLDATGVRRRLQALAAVGHSLDDIARNIGCSRNTVHDWRANVVVVTRATHERVDQLYRELADMPPAGRRIMRVRNDAARRGWLSPLWWDDDTIDDPDHNPRTQNVDDLCTADMVVVERLIDGIPPLHVTRAERIEAVRLLNSRGWSRSLIAQQLAMSGARVAQILDVLVHTENHTRVTADSQRRVG